MKYRRKPEIASKLKEMEFLGYVSPKEAVLVQFALDNPDCDITLTTEQNHQGILTHQWQFTLTKTFNKPNEA